MGTREVVVKDAHEMTVGELRTVSIGDDEEVLLARLSTGFVATQPKCTHYGAPLVDGTVHNDELICPWHHACFALKTGTLIEPPGLDGLKTYPVTEDSRGVVIQLDEASAPEIDAGSGDDERVFAIVGTGAAGLHAAEALRQEGFAGRVVLISKEEVLPYDRPNNSKDYLQGEAPEEWMYFRDRDFYDAHDIELALGREVHLIDAAERRIHFRDGETLQADGIIVATGAAARELKVPGADQHGVFTLRSIHDSEAIRAAAEGAVRAVVIGASFVGLEAAMSLRELGVEQVTVVAPEETPLASVFGEQIGARIQAIHQDHGVTFRLGEAVQCITGTAQADGVRLRGGEKLSAELIVAGIGVRPRSDVLQGVERDEDGGVVVDETLQAAQGVYVVGDIAAYPEWRSGERVRIEHWRLAAQHGRLAARNLLGAAEPYRGVPFFWSAHFDTVVQYLGHASAWDAVEIDGDPEEDFIAYYLRDGRIDAAAAVGRDEDMTALHHLMRADALPPLETLVAKGPAEHLATTQPA